MSKKIISRLQKLLFLVVFVLFSFSLTVQAAGEAVKITGQPGNVMVEDGKTAATTVKATGDGLKYQWYYTSNGNEDIFYKSSTTGATYSTIMNSSREGRKIYCVVTDKYGNKVKSNTVVLGIKGSKNVAKITRQPANMIVKSGDTASASVQATGLGLKYQWYYTLNGQDNTFYTSSTTKATYSTIMNENRAGRKIYCVVTDVYGNKVKSQTVTLGMNSGKTLAIIQQPTTMNYVKAGENVRVGIKATGDGLKYQWYYTLNGKDGTFYKSSNTTDTYSTIMNEERDGRRIYCLVTDQYGNSVGSIIVALNLLKPLTVTVDPKVLKVNLYDTKKLTAAVSGGVPPYTYEWYEYYEPYGRFYFFIYDDGDNYQGATTNVLTVHWGEAIYSSLEDAYFCRVIDSAGNKAESNFVYIGDPKPLQFEEQSGGVMPETGETVRFGVEVIGGVKKYSYQWQYTKAGMNGYQNIGEGDTWAKGYDQEVLLVTVDNTIYNGDYAFRCVVTDRESTTIYSNPAQVKRPPLRVVRNPNGRTAAWGEEVVLTVEAEGGKEPYRYIWECAHQGENDFMTVGDNSATLKVGAGHIYGGEANEEFRCIVIDAEGTRVISGNALIRIRKY